MLYKEYGKTGKKLSSLGFGIARMPMIYDADGKAAGVDDEKAIPLIDKALELGVNIFDTGHYYMDGFSEGFTGRAFKGRRDKVFISTKNGSDGTYDGWMKWLERSLTELQTDYIDFYLFWGLSLSSWNENINVKGGLVDAMRKAKDEGVIRHISFSTHDEPENIKGIADSGFFESVLLQYNLLDRSNEDTIRHCGEKGLGVSVMGPVGGGRLREPSKVIQEILGEKVKSTAELALRFVLSNPHVNVAFSGMESFENIEENAATASVSGPLTPDEWDRVDKNFKDIKNLADLYCTGCNYCKPCPQGIDIGKVFKFMNYDRIYGLKQHAKWEYSNLLKPESNDKPATACTECGECEKKCPQKIEIIKQLKETHEALK
ncbi:MAG: aldo/keto reductase [Defluviitaleaceae bacterium]|nr:aldo/keto reductase [Defluviitaleaceae bacterium]